MGSNYELNKETIRQALQGLNGEVRVNCPACEGTQSNTLGANADSGFFQCFRCGVKGNLNNGDTEKSTPEWIWEQCTACANHPYLQEKHVQSYGLRVDKYQNLVVPLEQHGQIATLQFIQHQKPTDPNDSRKKLLSKAKGGIKKGSYFVLPGDNAKLYICEGYATAASVHEATGFTTVMAVDSGNLLPVAKAIHRKYQDSHLIFAADNDRAKPESDPGYDAGYRGATKAAAAVNGSISMPKQAGFDFNDLHLDQGLDAVRQQLAKAAKQKEEVGRVGFNLVRADSLECKPPKWLIKPLLEADSLGLIFGDPSCGKSFLAIDIACCIVTGKDFHGYNVDPGPVVYVAGEGLSGLARRFRAWEIRHQASLAGAQLFVSTGPAGFCDPELAADVTRTVDRVAADGPPKLIVVDTLARNFGPGDENSNRDMGFFLSALDRLRVKYGCTILVLHHTGHGDKNRERGAFALRGGLDASVRLSKATDGKIWYNPLKAKDASLPDPLAFQLHVVELGFQDEDENEVTSAILNLVEGEPHSKSAKAGRGKWQQVALEQLQRLEREQRKRLERKGFNPDQARVSIETWRDACLDQGMSRQSWNNAKRSLSDREAVSCNEKFVKSH